MTVGRLVVLAGVHQQTLTEHLPIPGATWRWSDCNLSRSILCDRRNRGLSEQREDEWTTTRCAWDALKRYGNTSGDERGEIVGQQELEAYIEEAREKQ